MTTRNKPIAIREPIHQAAHMIDKYGHFEAIRRCQDNVLFHGTRPLASYWKEVEREIWREKAGTSQ